MTNVSTSLTRKRELLDQEINRMDDMATWIAEGVASSSKEYDERLQNRKSTDETLQKANWKMVEWAILQDQAAATKERLRQILLLDKVSLIVCDSIGCASL